MKYSIGDLAYDIKETLGLVEQLEEPIKKSKEKHKKEEGFNFVNIGLLESSKYGVRNLVNDKKLEKESKEVFNGDYEGPKTYFKVISYDDKFFRLRYVVFYTPSGQLLQPPALNPKPMERLRLILQREGKGYIQDMKKEGIKGKGIQGLKRVPQLDPRFNLDSAIEKGLAVKLDSILIK